MAIRKTVQLVLTYLVFALSVSQLTLADSVVKFKDNKITVFSYNHHRSAFTPGRNLTEKCECEILVSRGPTDDQIFIQLRGIKQEYYLSPLEEQEITQLQEPFIVKFSNESEVVSLLTAANESLSSLSIKNQVIHTVLPNKNLYVNLAKNKNATEVEWDLTKLPFGLCNATVQVNEENQDTKVTIEAKARACQVYNLGGGQLTDESRFLLETTFNSDDFTLKQRREDVDVEMTTSQSDKKAVIDYEYSLIFSKFEDANPDFFKMEKITEEHHHDELNELNLY